MIKTSTILPEFSAFSLWPCERKGPWGGKRFGKKWREISQENWPAKLLSREYAGQAII
jgi:hypothetical protein